MTRKSSNLIVETPEGLMIQLRDDNPEIRYPGIFSLFGGGIKETEKPEEAMRREAMEELGLNLITFNDSYEYDWSKIDYNTLLDTITAKLPNVRKQLGFDPNDEKIKTLFSNKIDYLFKAYIKDPNELTISEGQKVILPPEVAKAIIMIPTDKIMLLHYLSLKDDPYGKL